MNTGDHGQERRAVPRYGCAGHAEIVVPGCGLRYRGQIADLSAAGCFIETACRLERGTSVEVWMQAEGVPLRVAAFLMERHANGVGFRFSGLSPRKLEQIRTLIADLEQDGAAKI